MTSMCAVRGCHNHKQNNDIRFWWQMISSVIVSSHQNCWRPVLGADLLICDKRYTNGLYLLLLDVSQGEGQLNWTSLDAVCNLEMRIVTMAWLILLALSESWEYVNLVAPMCAIHMILQIISSFQRSWFSKYEVLLLASLVPVALAYQGKQKEIPHCCLKDLCLLKAVLYIILLPTNIMTYSIMYTYSLFHYVHRETVYIRTYIMMTSNY